jgi:polysaccharide export outer membrane protein
MRSKALFAIFYFAMAAVVSGCLQKGPAPNAKVEDLAARQTETKQELKAINDRLFASMNKSHGIEDYVLGEGDLLQLSVFESPELKTETRVSARGFVTLPLLGAVDVKELTTREAEQKIEDLYRTKYIQNPHVNVFVKEQVSKKVLIIGAVKKPGALPYLARENLFEVLAKAEGLSDNAGKMVQVRRAGSETEKPSMLLVDMDQLATGGGDELNIEIKSGDIIYVPEAGTMYIDGAVRRPGNYQVRRKMTIPEAIIVAGGFTPYAKRDDIKLVRATKGEGKLNVVQLSLKDMEHGSSRDLEVQDRDIIFVETNLLEAFIYGLRVTGLGGVVGMGYEPPTAH